MESRELKKRLRWLGEEANNRFHFLNNGGCCVFAAAVAGELERLGVPCEVIVPTPYDETTLDLSEIRQHVTNVNEKTSWNNAGVYFTHVAVRFKAGGRWHTYDSDGIRKGKFEFGTSTWAGGAAYVAANGGMTAKEAKALADERTGWNHMFDRRNVAPVRKMVRDMLRA